MYDRHRESNANHVESGFSGLDIILIGISYFTVTIFLAGLIMSYFSMFAALVFLVSSAIILSLFNIFIVLRITDFGRLFY